MHRLLILFPIKHFASGFAENRLKPRIFIPLICLTLSLFLCQPVYGAVAVSGGGVVEQKPYWAAAYIDDTAARLRILIPNEEELEFIFSGGGIKCAKGSQLSGTFAKLIIEGVLDPFLILEIVSGLRDDLYSPYLTEGPGNTMQLNIQPEDFFALYEKWIPHLDNLQLAEKFVRQIVSVLEASVSYTIHLDPNTGDIAAIDIQSISHAPEARHSTASFKVTQVQSQEQLPSS